MALHFYPTTNNNSWGVKINPNGEVYYEHILHFLNDTLRDDFIAKNLFNNESNWKALVMASKAQGDKQYDPNICEFKITTDATNWADTLQKNYAVAYDDATKKFSFWAIQGATSGNHNIVSFRGRRDWMLELDITKIFDPNKQVLIDRAHVPDVVEGLWNISQDSENSNVEPIEDFSEDNFVRISHREIANIEYSNSGFTAESNKGWSAYIFQPSIDRANDVSSLIISSVYGDKWSIWANTNQSVITQAKLNAYLKYSQFNEIVPVVIFLVPNSDRIKCFQFQTPNNPLISNSQFKTLFNASPQLLKIVPLPYSPLNTSSISSITTSGNDYLVHFYENFNGTTNIDEKEIGVHLQSDATSPNYEYFGFMKHLVNGIDIETSSFSLNNANYDSDSTKSFVLNNVAKLHKYPYKQVYAKNVSGSRFNIYQQVLTNSYRWQLGFTYAPDVWHLIMMIRDVDNLDGIYNSPFQYGIRLDDIAPFTMPRENNTYLTYINNNESQVNQQFRRMGWNLGFGTAQTAISSTLGREPLSFIFGAIGGAQLINNSILDIQQQKAMLNDLKRNPSSVSGNGGDVMGVLPMTTMKPIEFTDELWPELKASVGQFFHQFGSQLNQRFRNINNYLTTRYHFNYLQTRDLFENFSIELNNSAKTLISNSFRNGVWIWHVRDNNFKGVKNFDVNNIQMDMLRKDN